MKKRIAIFAAAIALLGAGGFAALDTLNAARAENPAQQAAANEQTVTLTVENMTCALCPVTVKKAMEGVTGVKSVTVDFEAKTATVVFDPSAVSVADIAAASANAGYPAKPAGQDWR